MATMSTAVPPTALATMTGTFVVEEDGAALAVAALDPPAVAAPPAVVAARAPPVATPVAALDERELCEG